MHRMQVCTHGMHGNVNQAQANKFGAVTFMWKWFGASSRHDTNEAHVTKTEILSSTESLLIIHCAICGKSHCLRKMFRISCGNLTNPVEEVVQRWRNAEAAGRCLLCRRTMMVNVNYCSFLWVTSLFKSKCRFSFTLMTQFSSQEERKRCVLRECWRWSVEVTLPHFCLISHSAFHVKKSCGGSLNRFLWAWCALVFLGGIKQDASKQCSAGRPVWISHKSDFKASTGKGITSCADRSAAQSMGVVGFVFSFFFITETLVFYICALPHILLCSWGRKTVGF